MTKSPRRSSTLRWVAALGVFAILATGCGSVPDEPKVSTESTACRKQWTDLAGTYADRDHGTYVSDLSSRWNAILATADYYGQVGTAKDCDDALTSARTNIDLLTEFSGRLRSYDVPFQVNDLSSVADDYLDGDTPKPRRIGGNGPAKGRLVKPPTKKAVRAALTRLEASAPAAVADMQSGWDAAQEVDLGNTKALAQLFKDMRFLAGDSTPFQTAASDLGVLRRAAQFVG